MDLAPTIADLIGAPAAPDWQGRSLFDERHPCRAYFYVAENHFRLAVREANWKYIYSVSDGRDELYDLDADPLEQRNVAAQHPDRCNRLRQRLAAWTEANRRQYSEWTPRGSANSKAVSAKSPLHHRWTNMPTKAITESIGRPVLHRGPRHRRPF